MGHPLISRQSEFVPLLIDYLIKNVIMNMHMIVLITLSSTVNPMGTNLYWRKTQEYL